MKRNKKNEKSKPRRTIQFKSKHSIFEDKENISHSSEKNSESEGHIPQIRESQFLSKRHKLQADSILSKKNQSQSASEDSESRSSRDSYLDLNHFTKRSSESENEKADQLFILPDHLKANPEANVQRVLKMPKIVYKEKPPKPKPLNPTIKPDEVFKFQQEHFYPKVRETKIKKKAVKKNKELKHIKRDIDKKGFGKFDPVQYGNFEDKARFKKDNRTGLSAVTKFAALDDYNVHNRKLYAWEEFEGPRKNRKCTDLVCVFIFGIGSEDGLKERAATGRRCLRLRIPPHHIEPVALDQRNRPQRPVLWGK